MRVHKGLIPYPRSIISNLDDIGKSSEAVRLHQELKFWGVPIVGTIERPLCGSNCIAEGDRRIYVRGASSIKFR